MKENTEEKVDRDGYKYGDFMASQPSSLSGKPTPAEVVDWIHEIEMAFGCYDYSDRQKTIFARQLQASVLSWWKQVVMTMLKEETWNMSWEDFLM